MTGMYDCWECGRHAPSGVCPGPHPEYDHNRAVRQHHVARPSELVYVRQAPRKAVVAPVQRECEVCLTPFLSTGRVTCSDGCLRVYTRLRAAEAMRRTA